MIRINLIPPEILAAQEKKEQQILMGVGVGAIAAVVALFWVVKSHQAGTLKEQVRAAQSELEAYRTVDAQIQQIQQEREQLVKKRSVIQEVNQDRLVYPKFFEDLLPLSPADVWFTNLNIEERAGARTVSITTVDIVADRVELTTELIGETPEELALVLEHSPDARDGARPRAAMVERARGAGTLTR